MRLAATLALLLASASAACTAGTFPTDDAGMNSGCPTAQPNNGDSCSLPDGTTCSFATGGSCGGGASATCNGGRWSVAVFGGPPAPVSCPASIPTQGTPCTQSCGAQQSCSYGCDQGGPASATCNGTWQVQRLGITCPVDAGVDASDAGHDAGSAVDASDASKDAPLD